jgi:hypothetical protein
MSERYGECRQCRGTGEILVRDAILLRHEKVECGTCGGTGMGGGAVVYMENQISIEHARELLMNRELRGEEK